MAAPPDGIAPLDAYWFPLDASAERCAGWRAWLSPAELRRADRFLDPAHGARYVAAHAHLRWLLAQRLAASPPPNAPGSTTRRRRSTRATSAVCGPSRKPG